MKYIFLKGIAIIQHFKFSEFKRLKIVLQKSKLRPYLFSPTKITFAYKLICKLGALRLSEKAIPFEPYNLFSHYSKVKCTNVEHVCESEGSQISKYFQLGRKKSVLKDEWNQNRIVPTLSASYCGLVHSLLSGWIIMNWKF